MLSAAGSNRCTLMVTSSAAISVPPRFGFVLSELDRRVADRRSLWSVVCDCVLQELHIVPLLEVQSGVRAPTLFPLERAHDDGLRDVQHALQLVSTDEVHVVDLAFVLDGYVPELRLKFLDLRQGLLHAVLVAEDADLLDHGLLHLCPDVPVVLGAVLVQQGLDSAFRLPGALRDSGLALLLVLLG